MSQQLNFDFASVIAKPTGFLAGLVKRVRRSAAALPAPVTAPEYPVDDVADDEGEEIAERLPVALDDHEEAQPIALSWVKKGHNWHLVEAGKLGRKRATVSPRGVTTPGAAYRAVIKGRPEDRTGHAAKPAWCYVGTVQAGKRYCERWHREQSGFGNIPPVTIG